jgi:hypothetical protein
MGKDFNELAMRDPAAAAIFGDMGADFGGEQPYDPYGPYSAYGPTGPNSGYGSHGPHAEMAGSYEPSFAGFEFAADATDAAISVAHPAHPLHTDNPRLQAIVAQHLAESRATSQRTRLLEPNAGSKVKVERYRFALNQNVNVGTAANFTISGAPDFNLRPQRVVTNVSVPGFILISEGKVANVSFTSGGSLDAWELNANAVDSMLDIPTLSPANKATIIMSSSTFIPTGFTNTSVFTFVVSFVGWSTIAA